jgi:hypothetical protein
MMFRAQRDLEDGWRPASSAPQLGAEETNGEDQVAVA